MHSFLNVFAPSPPPSPTRSTTTSPRSPPQYAPSPKLEQEPFSPRHHHRHARTLSLGPFSTSIPSNAAARARLARSLIWVVALFVACWMILQRGQEWWSRTPLQELNRWSSHHGRTHLEREIEVDQSLQGHGYPMSRALERTAGLHETAVADAPEPVATPGQTHKLRSRAHLQAASKHVVVHRSIPSPESPSSTDLTPPQELASLLNFLVSNAGGTLPPLTVYNPTETPLAPEWVLDFEPGPAGPKRDAKIKAFENEVWEGVGRLVIVGRDNHVWMREVSKLLKGEYRVDPGYMNVVNLNERADSQTLTPLLNRLLAREADMHIILAGTSIGGYEDLKSLHEAGKLKGMLDSAGIRILPVPKVVKKRPKAANKQKK